MIWALQVVTGEELRLAQLIRERIERVDCILPTRELFEKRGEIWRKVTRTMLPGYLFLKIPESQTDGSACEIAKLWHQVRHTAGVLRILGTMQREDRARLKALENGGLPWGISTGTRRGGILDGPLAEHEDWIVEIDWHRRRAKIRLKIGEDVHDITVGICEDGDQGCARFAGAEENA